MKPRWFLQTFEAKHPTLVHVLSSRVMRDSIERTIRLASVIIPCFPPCFFFSNQHLAKKKKRKRRRNESTNQAWRASKIHLKERERRAGRRGGGKRIRVTLVIFHTIFNDGSFNWTLHACLHGTRERRMQIGQWQMILLFPCLASCMRLLRPGIVPIPQAGRRLSTRIFFARSFVRRRIPRSSRLDAARGATMNEEKKRRSVTGPLSSPLLWWRRFILAISTHPSSPGQPKIFFISFVDAAKASTLFPRDSVQLRDWFHLRENFVAKSVIVLDFGPVRFYT